MCNFINSIASTSIIENGKDFLRTDESNTVIIILSEDLIRNNSSASITEQQRLIEKTCVSTLLSTIVQKKYINKALCNLSFYIQNKMRTKREYCIVIKNPRHIEIYSYKSVMCSCDRDDEYGTDTEEEYVCEWTTKRCINVPYIPPNYKKKIKPPYVFIFTGRHIPSILRNFSDDICAPLFVKIIYITRDDEFANVGLDDLLEHLPYKNCTMKVLIQRLKSNNRS